MNLSEKKLKRLSPVLFMRQVLGRCKASKAGDVGVCFGFAENAKNAQNK